MRSTPLTRSVDAFKALAHPGRLRMQAMLQDGPLAVCQITSVLHLAASTVSAHLGELRRAGLLDDHKEGRFVSCALTSEPGARRLVADALRAVEDDDQVREDRRRASQLRRLGAPAQRPRPWPSRRRTAGKHVEPHGRPRRQAPDRSA